MAIRLNPFTGKFDLVGDGVSSVADGYEVENRTITATEASNKFVTLANTPTAPTKVTLDIVSGTPQKYGTDFTVIGNQLSWNGLGLDVTLGEGDDIRIIYPL